MSLPMIEGSAHPYTTEHVYFAPECPVPVPMSSEEYGRLGGAWCPVCGSYEIEGVGGGFDIEGTFAYNGMYCINCGATWEDKYKLVGYSQLVANPLP